MRLTHDRSLGGKSQRQRGHVHADPELPIRSADTSVDITGFGPTATLFGRTWGWTSGSVLRSEAATDSLASRRATGDAVLEASYRWAIIVTFRRPRRVTHYGVHLPCRGAPIKRRPPPLPSSSSSSPYLP